MPLPSFTDADIDEVARAFGITCDAQRRDILRHRESVDIRACAGSGKTTLLVAKLALLLSRWDKRFRGIAVLSHTNVAHHEIRRRFKDMPRLRSLESYPHFIGTIQSFVNMTVGIPGTVERFGQRPAVIDDEISGQRALAKIRHRSYATARGWLSRQPNGDGLVACLRFEFDRTGELVLGSSAGSLPSPTSPTGQALRRLKDSLVADGIFRYDDMDAIGEWHLSKHPKAKVAICYRFPIVLFDETQDTRAGQGRLLESMCADSCVVQRFGDDRQAIYRGIGDSEEGVEFPKTGYLPMTSSLRLSPSIARLAEGVCIGTVEPLSGLATRADHPHTVFLFTPTTIHSVLPAFAQLVGSHLGYGIPSSRVMAIGFRRTGSGDPNRIPIVISDYHRIDTQVRSPVTAHFDTLSEYLSAALDDIRRTRNTSDASERMLRAACRVLELQGVRDSGRLFRSTRLIRLLRDTERTQAPQLLTNLAALFNNAFAAAPVAPTAAADAIMGGLAPLCAVPWNLDVQTFCTAAPASPWTPPSQPQMTSPEGVFRLATAGGAVEVGFGTIHGVKGETLDAVLVLSTYYYDHDLKKLLEVGVLCGRRPTTTQSRQVRLQDNVKRIHVAMTRPTSLLCLAMREDHVSAAQRTDMERLGWSFQTVT